MTEDIPPKTFKVLITDSISESGIALFNSSDEYRVKFDPSLNGESLKNEIPYYDALIIRSGTCVTSDIINAADNLRVIGRAGAGVDNVEIKAATRKGVVVMNVPSGNTVAACEHTWALMLSLLRNIPSAHNDLRAGKWSKKKFSGKELYGKKLGIAGLGKIGFEVAKRASAFGMDIIVYDPFINEERLKRARARLVGFDEFLSESDIISLHMPLNENTEKIFNAEAFSKMKRTAFFVNCARGGLVDETALAEALNNKVISGAAVDVYSVEPVSDSVLFSADNIVHTPHLGASTDEAQERVSVEIIRQVINFLETGLIVNAVNAVFDNADLVIADAAEKTGILCGQLSSHLTSKVIISYKDKIIKSGDCLARMFLKGYLSQFMGGINLVNALIAAEDRGVDIVLQSLSSSRMRGDFRADAGGGLIAECGIDGEAARLKGLRGYSFDIPLAGRLLMIENEDSPGVVGSIGAVMGNHGLNIASMEVSRKSAGGPAMIIIVSDGIIPDEVISEMKAVRFLKSVKLVKVGQ